MYAQGELQHLGLWNHLEKLALIFLFNFHHEHSLLKLVIKKLSPKINVKNIKTRVKSGHNISPIINLWGFFQMLKGS